MRAHAVGVANAHLAQAPGLFRRRLEDLDGPLGELGVDAVDVANLHPQLELPARFFGALARDLQVAATEEEDHPAPELPVDVETEDVAVEVDGGREVLRPQ